jgi:hypothetical protein
MMMTADAPAACAFRTLVATVHALPRLIITTFPLALAAFVSAVHASLGDATINGALMLRAACVANGWENV